MVTITEEKRKLGTAHQQNLIEMFQYIYLAPKKWNAYSLAHEMNKSIRTIKRMVADINEFIPCITKFVNPIDSNVYYDTVEKISESDLDMLFEKNDMIQIFYVFLKSLYIRPVAMTEIIEKLNLTQKEARKVIDKVLDTTYLLDEIETENDCIIGNLKFFK